MPEITPESWEEEKLKGIENRIRVGKYGEAFELVKETIQQARLLERTEIMNKIFEKLEQDMEVLGINGDVWGDNYKQDLIDELNLIK